MAKYLTTAQAAEKLGVSRRQVHYLFAQKLIPDVPRFGYRRIITEDFLPVIHKALQAHRMLPERPVSAEDALLRLTNAVETLREVAADEDVPADMAAHLRLMIRKLEAVAASPFEEVPAPTKQRRRASR